MMTPAAASAVPFARPDVDFGLCTYVAIRPTAEIGEFTVSCFIVDYREVQLEIGLPDEPTRGLEWFDTVEDAVDRALQLKAEHPHPRVYYNGEELQAEFGCWRSLARLFVDFADEWNLVEQVATGRIAVTDAAIVEVARGLPIIAVAAQKVA